MKQTLSAHTISVAIGETSLLNNVSITLPVGQVTGVLGANGAGKSTLLKVLAGSLTPTTGRVSLRGKALSSFSARELAKERAVMTQESAVSFPFQANEVVAMGRDPWQEQAATTHRIVQETLAAVDMSAYATRLYPSLSGGERQRIQLARCLCQVWTCTTPVILLDEPVSALDPAHQYMVLAAARARAQAGAAVLVIVHDLNLAAAYCDHLFFLKKGYCHSHGPVTDMLNTATISDVFDIDVSVSTHPHSKHPFIIPHYESSIA